MGTGIISAATIVLQFTIVPVLTILFAGRILNLNGQFSVIGLNIYVDVHACKGLIYVTFTKGDEKSGKRRRPEDRIAEGAALRGV